MLLLRSLLFNALFYVNLTVLLILGLPLLFFGRRAIILLAHAWGWSSIWLMEKICGTRVEFRGREHLLKEGCIVAAKHQSAWETFALCTQLRDFTYILKRELTRVPLFGFYLIRADQIAIDRKSRSAALKQLVAEAGEAIAEGRAIFIFPEGTRRPAGAPPHYKAGVAHLYAAEGAPCVPVALNSGLFWPRRKFLRYPGTIVIEFLPVIPAGLPTAEFLPKLQRVIEEASDRLMAEALAENPGLAVNFAQKDGDGQKAD
jgi:1-acyl-sn-glycerol-3-phosphate acyltransferase